jgi:hypothetical protein
MRKRVQNLPEGQVTKTKKTINPKITCNGKKMKKHPKNKTRKAENTKLYSLLIPLIMAWSASAASTPKEKASHRSV